MYVHVGITLTKRQSTRLKLTKDIIHKNSLVLIYTEPIVNYVSIT